MRVIRTSRKFLIGLGSVFLVACLCEGIWAWSSAVNERAANQQNVEPPAQTASSNKPVRVGNACFVYEPLSWWNPFAIVKGTVTARHENEAFRDDIGFIYTPISVEVQEVLTGNIQGSLLQFYETGGEMEDEVFRVDGIEPVPVGECALFLIADNGIIQLIGEQTGEGRYTFFPRVKDVPDNVSLEELKAIIEKGAPEEG